MEFTAAHSISLIVIGMLNLGLAVLVIRTRSKQDVLPLGAFLLGISLWTIPQGVLLMEINPTIGLALSVIINSGAIAMATGLFHFALVYTERSDWLRPGRLGVVYAGTGIWLVVILTDPVHNFMHQPIEYTEVLLPVVEYQNLGYWLYVFWNWSLSAGGILLFFLEYVDARGNGFYDKQLRLVVLAPLIPGAANVLAFSGVTSVNYSVWGFGATGILIAIALYRYQWLELVPIARNRVIEEMRDGYLVIDDERRIVDYNSAAQTLVNIDDIIGARVTDVLPGCRPLLHESSEKMTITRGATVIDATVSPVGDGTTSGTVLILRDITKQRRAETRFQSLIENISDVIIVVDGTGEIVYMSPSVNTVLGYSSAELVGESMFDLIHEADRSRALAEFDVLRSKVSNHGRIEYRARHQDGSWVVLEGVAVDLLDNPIVGGVVINLRDVTERNERERELERSNQRLDEFAGVISHDLQGPLGLARNTTRMARKSKNWDDIEAVEEQMNRMESMIQRFLMMAQVGTTITETEPIKLRAVATDSWDVVRTDGCRLVFEVDDDWTVDGDCGQLRHAFENLFRNAVVHNDAPVTIEVGTLAGGDIDGFFVEDNGVGIDASIREYVFERGQTTRDEGTGFGLAIVRDVIEAHGWHIELCEGRDGGARFEVVTA